jgi:hypothetical protein
MSKLAVRKGVTDFPNAAETILSSVLIKPPLTEDERALIAEYVRQLSDEVERWNKRRDS